MHIMKEHIMGGFFMLLLFNKNKIFSYTIAASIVAILFIFSVLVLPNDDVRLIQVSSNTVNNDIANTSE